MICQMAALVRCALAEVCTVPVLLVNIRIFFELQRDNDDDFADKHT